jgi:DNA-damage-inducible protein J
MIAIKPETETITGCIYGDNCPIEAEQPHFNAVTLAAMQEARDIASGKIPGKWYHSIEEMRKDLGV